MESTSHPDWRVCVKHVLGGFGRTAHFPNDGAIKFKLDVAYGALFVQSWGGCQGMDLLLIVLKYYIFKKSTVIAFCSSSLSATISSSSLVRHVPLVSRGTWKQQETAPPAQRGHRGFGVGDCQEWDPLTAADNSPGQFADAPLSRQARQVQFTECAQHLCCLLQQREVAGTPEHSWGTLELLFTSVTVRLSFPAQQNRQHTQVPAGTQWCDDIKMLS